MSRMTAILTKTKRTAWGLLVAILLAQGAGLVLFLFANFPAAWAEVRDPKGVAVVVGNRNYRNDRVPEVSYAHRDAAAFRHYVVEVLGYDPDNVIDLKDADQATLESVFGNNRSHEGKLWRYLDPEGGSDVVVFYSGHGVPGLKDKRAYLLPVNADPDTAEINGYPIDVLYKNLSKLKDARSVRVFLDACFSGDSDRGMLVRAASPVFVKAELPKALKKLTVLTAASGQELASWDEKAEHGLFTHHLLDALYGKADGDRDGEKDGKVTAAEAKRYLDRHMTRAARRTFGRHQKATLAGEDSVVLSAVVEGRFAARPAFEPGSSILAPSAPPTARVPESVGSVPKPAANVPEPHKAVSLSLPAQAALEPGLGLKRGAKVLVQRGLGSLKFDVGPADGLFGKRTRGAIKAWQEAKGFAATGYLTKDQADALAAVGGEALRKRVERAGKAREAVERTASEEREREEAQRTARQKAERERAARETREREEAQRKAREAAERKSPANKASFRDAAVGVVFEGLPIIESIGDHSQRASALIEIAQVQAELGNVRDAEQTLQRALLAAEKLNDNDERSQVFVRIASTQTRLSPILKGRETFRKALSAAEKIIGGRERAGAFIHIAEYQLRADDLLDAENTASKALATLLEGNAGEGFEAMQFSAYLGIIAYVQAKTFESSQAKETFSMALSVAEGIEDGRTGIAIRFMALGQVAHHQAIAGEDSDASESLSKSLRLMNSTCPSPSDFKNLIMRLTCERYQSSVTLGTLLKLHRFQDVLSMVEKMRGSPILLVNGFLEIAKEQVAAGGKGTVAGLFSRASTFAHQIEKGDERAEWFTKISRLQAELGGNVHGAEKTLSIAIPLAQHIKDDYKRTRVLTNIAYTQAKIGNFTGATQTFSEAMRVAKKIGSNFLRIQAFMAIANAQAQVA